MIRKLLVLKFLLLKDLQKLEFLNFQPNNWLQIKFEKNHFHNNSLISHH
ncbi:hypothetical protein HMPREF0204_10044 [Chryseobacterium gleum ATCC 35910]|uniref:Uncharacterized protein n=1 Tax=Chryseobacterium gleum ATCC 35910 TaxID=525257 RepID=A0ABN0AY56_CHRGE|nr:hypothetical protein HMPREF0204_10044 [Chryseobacterium gleum ATCC 35910]